MYDDSGNQLCIGWNFQTVWKSPLYPRAMTSFSRHSKKYVYFFGGLPFAYNTISSGVFLKNLVLDFNHRLTMLFQQDLMLNFYRKKIQTCSKNQKRCNELLSSSGWRKKKENPPAPPPPLPPSLPKSKKNTNGKHIKSVIVRFYAVAKRSNKWAGRQGCIDSNIFPMEKHWDNSMKTQRLV